MSHCLGLWQWIYSVFTTLTLQTPCLEVAENPPAVLVISLSGEAIQE